MSFAIVRNEFDAPEKERLPPVATGAGATARGRTGRPNPVVDSTEPKKGILQQCTKVINPLARAPLEIPLQILGGE